MGLNSRLVDFLEYFKHQALVGILMSSLGFMEAYFPLALFYSQSFQLTLKEVMADYKH